MSSSPEMPNIFRRQAYDALQFLHNIDELLNRDHPFLSNQDRAGLGTAYALAGIGHALVAIFNLLDNHFNSEE